MSNLVILGEPNLSVIFQFRAAAQPDRVPGGPGLPPPPRGDVGGRRPGQGRDSPGRLPPRLHQAGQGPRTPL